MNQIAHLIIGIQLIVACEVLVLIVLTLRQSRTVEIIRRHGGTWHSVRWVAPHSKHVKAALDTPGLAIRKAGKIEEGTQ